MTRRREPDIPVRKLPSEKGALNMWLALGLLVFVGVWATGIIVFTFTGGLRTRNGTIVGLQRSPEDMETMVARVQERQERYDRWLKRLR